MKRLKAFAIFILLNSLAFSQTTFFTGGNICKHNNWNLIFSDEFDDDTLDHTVWFTYYPCNDNWNVPCEEARVGDNNLWLEENVIESNGTVKLIAKKETASWYSTTRNFTSGLLFSNGSNRFAPGKFDIYCKIPSGKGLHAAFWLFGGNNNGTGTEIDIFEFRGQKPKYFHSTIYKYNETEVDAHHDCTFEGVDFSEAFHLYSVEWDPFFIVFKIDNEAVCTMTRLYTLAGSQVNWCCVEPGLYNTLPAYPPGQNNQVSVIANLGIGTGDDSPDNTQLPAQFEIDYIRIYQRDTSSNEKGECAVILYPSITNSDIGVKKKRMTSVSIMSVQGQILFLKDFRGDEITIDVSNFEQGIYFVEVNSADGTFANKFIKY